MKHGVRGRRLAAIAGAIALFCVGVPAGHAALGVAGIAVSSDDPTTGDLSVALADSADPVRLGDEFDYTATIRNLGPPEAARVKLQVSLPDGLQLVSITGARRCDSDGALLCTLQVLPHDAAVPVVFRVRAIARGTFTTVVTASPPWPDRDTGNNTASESTRVESPARLEIVEKITNDDGGTASPGDFSLRVDGTNADPSAFAGSEQGTVVGLDPGPYAVALAAAPAGYDSVLSLECAGTIAPGETKVCTIASNDRPAHLKVAEHVVNDDGAKRAASSFALGVVNASARPASFAGSEDGTDVTVAAGAYSVTAATVLGYQTTLGADCAGTIAPGESRTCTVTSDDVLPLGLSLSADAGTVTTGSRVGYSATLSNRNGQAAVARSVSVHLPDGFAYRPGSSSGLTTADPQVDGRTLSWSGSFEVAGHGSASLHFAATAPAVPGSYAATASGSVDAPFTVASDPSGAAVTVRPEQQPAPTGTPTQPPPAPAHTTTPDPPPTTDPTALPPPVFQQSADLEPVAGTVLVRLPGTTDFVRLTSPEQAPIGTEVDATAGRMGLSTVDGAGTRFHAEFSEGCFKLDKQLANGVTVLRLTGGDFRSCKATTRALASADKKPKKRPKRLRSQRSVRHLWGSGKGRFQTRGRYLAATVHGTTWFTEDRCDASRAYVQEGVVAVRDLVLRKTVRVSAGQSYVARPRR
jgi:uncharacterized repeat protein (TIGR01451 family)